MATRKRPGQIAVQALISIVLAALLVGLATLARAALGPKLGGFSPFMLYVAAVLIAGLVRGPLCGALVMLGGGVLGFTLFLSTNGVAPPGSVVALMIFWGVAFGRPRPQGRRRLLDHSSTRSIRSPHDEWSISQARVWKRRLQGELSTIGLNFLGKGVW
jgi:hypothetical protein